MEILAWLGFPVVATLSAIGWASWSSRTRRPQGMDDSMAAYEKFRRALGGATGPDGQR